MTRERERERKRERERERERDCVCVCVKKTGGNEEEGEESGDADRVWLETPA
jgi:hypothetical protein